MPGKSDIEQAFRNAIKLEQNGRRTVTTSDFVQELARLNWFWSQREANVWIESYVTSFKDISTQEGQGRTFMLFNPYGVF